MFIGGYCACGINIKVSRADLAVDFAVGKHVSILSTGFQADQETRDAVVWNIV